MDRSAQKSRVTGGTRTTETATVGMIGADIELSNPSKPELKPLTVRAMVDTRAMTICIPQHIAVQLQLPEIEKREVTTADEQSHIVPYF